MLSQLKKLQLSLNSCNENSLSLLASLSSSSCSLSPSPVPPTMRLPQLIEIWLFDLTTILQSANLKVSPSNTPPAVIRTFNGQPHFTIRFPFFVVLCTGFLTKLTKDW